MESATAISQATLQQPLLRILDNLDGTFCLQACDEAGEWQTAYEGADGVSRAEVVYAMEMWLGGLGYARAQECGTDEACKPLSSQKFAP